VAGLVLAFGVGTAAAQDAPDVSGPPRGLQPPDISQGANSKPANADSGDQAPKLRGGVSDAPVSGVGAAGPAAVQVGALATINGPLVGTLDDSNGGLGSDEWSGSDRAVMETLLAAMPVASASPVERAMIRKLLLTRAPPPPGPVGQPFNALRIVKLLQGGLISDAADLAAQARVKDDPITPQWQAAALLYAGRDGDACGDATAYRLQAADEAWIELRAFCYALNGDGGPLDLTRSIIQAQGMESSAFDAALDALSGGDSKPPEMIDMPSALDIRMFERLQWPIPEAAVEALGPAAEVSVLRDANTPSDMKLALAAKLFSVGMLNGKDFDAVLDLYEFKPEDIAVAAAQAPAEDTLKGLALLRVALMSEPRSDKRAELLDTALRISAQKGVFTLAVEEFSNDIAALSPVSGWGNWSPRMADALLLSGKPDAAERWYGILDTQNPAQLAAKNRLEIAFGWVAPTPDHLDRAQAAMSRLVPPPLAVPVVAPGEAAEAIDPNAPGAPVVPPDAAIKAMPKDEAARAALLIGLSDALGKPVPADARAALAPLLDSDLPGRRPPQALLQRIDDAALKGRRGELLLAIVSAMGPQGPADLAPDIVVGMVRALRTAGIGDVALALALEAVLGR
jgi:hypothetical protein